MGVMLSAGGSFQWYRNNLADAERAEAARRKKDPYDILCAEAAKAPAGSEGLFFLPYLTGERTPHANPHAKAAWIGLTARHGKAHMIRSLLEGVTFGMRDSLEIIQGMGVPIREIRVSGGGARSGFWRQMQADVFGQTVKTINASEGPAFGVALLAGVGTGAFKDIREACDSCIRITSATRPKPQAVRLYNRNYPMFQKLYRCWKPNSPPSRIYQRRRERDYSRSFLGLQASPINRTLAPNFLFLRRRIVVILSHQLPASIRQDSFGFTFESLSTGLRGKMKLHPMSMLLPILFAGTAPSHEFKLRLFCILSQSAEAVQNGQIIGVQCYAVSERRFFAHC